MNMQARGDIHPVSPRAFLYLIAIFAFWTLFPYFSNFNLDHTPDMLENHAWGIRWQWGNSKHPPLFGWTVALWFEFFPRTDLFYRALASLNLTISLGLMVLIARRLLTPIQQDAALFVSLFMPLLGFQAIRYNANSAMLPYWAATVLFYLRLMEKPHIRDAVMLGFAAGAALLSKYFSATLFVALFIHAVLSGKTRRILFSQYGATASLVFLLSIAPHIVWLFENDFSPFVFAAKGQGDSSLLNQLYYQADFLIGQFAYALPGVAVLIVFRKPSEGLQVLNFGHALPILQSEKGKVLLFSFFGAIFAAMVMALAAGAPLTSNWGMPIHIVVPILVVLLLPKHLLIARAYLVPLIGGVGMMLLLALSPVILERTISKPKDFSALPIQALVGKAVERWNEEVDQPLEFATGDSAMSYGMAFYGPGTIHVVDLDRGEGFPWVPKDQFVEKDTLVICREETCILSWESYGWVARTLGYVEVPAPEGSGISSPQVAHMWTVRRPATEGAD